MFLKRKEIDMKELKPGERISVTLEVVEQGDTCEGCFLLTKKDVLIYVLRICVLMVRM